MIASHPSKVSFCVGLMGMCHWMSYLGWASHDDSTSYTACSSRIPAQSSEFKADVLMLHSVPMLAAGLQQ